MFVLLGRRRELKRKEVCSGGSFVSIWVFFSKMGCIAREDKEG